MGVPINTTRQALLERGWYVVADVQTAFLGLSGKAHDLLIIIKHFQGTNADARPDQARLASITGQSVKTVARTLAELARKGAITVSRTGRANRYTATYVLGTASEIRVLMGGELEIPAELVPSDRTTVVRSDRSDSGSSPSYKEPLQNQIKILPPTGGGDAEAPQSKTEQEDVMGFKGPRPQHAVQDEFDPATSLGLWETQESAETATDGLETLFPDEEVTQPAVSPRKRARTQAQADSAGSLAIEFDQLVRQQPWAGPSPVNRAALARNLSQWKRDGLSADQIRSMMQRYVAPDYRRAKGKTPWIDFLGQRHKLIAAGAKSQEARALEEHRNDADASYWLGSMAGGR
jgi:hypothetical protein